MGGLQIFSLDVWALCNIINISDLITSQKYASSQRMSDMGQHAIIYLVPQCAPYTLISPCQIAPVLIRWITRPISADQIVNTSRTRLDLYKSAWFDHEKNDGVMLPGCKNVKRVSMEFMAIGWDPA